MSNLVEIVLYAMLLLTLVALAFIMGVNHERRRTNRGG